MAGAAATLPDAQPAAGFSLRDGVTYGALGLPLAFLALPLYVTLPHHYAVQHGLPLAVLGAVLLGTRLLDAVADPFIGQAIDRRFAQGGNAIGNFSGNAIGNFSGNAIGNFSGNAIGKFSGNAIGKCSGHAIGRWAAAGAVVLAGAFTALFYPPVSGRAALLAWLISALLMTYLAFSLLTVLHQSWGTRLGGDEARRARVVAWREGFGLFGVLLASVLPALAGLGATCALLAASLAAGVWLLGRSPAPHATAGGAVATAAWTAPWADARFRGLLGVFMLNGVASAVPATLVLFFVQDRLQAAAWTPAFLGAYFAAAVLSLPAWLRLVRRLGLVSGWLAGMLLSVLAFAGAGLLGSGDEHAFLAVCIASGIALGADLALPGALLNGVVQRGPHGLRAAGAYAGWWTAATKLNLGLAAGAALPLLGLAGYAPGARDAASLQVLGVAYVVLPCALKLAAAALLWRWHDHQRRNDT